MPNPEVINVHSSLSTVLKALSIRLKAYRTAFGLNDANTLQGRLESDFTTVESQFTTRLRAFQRTVAHASH